MNITIKCVATPTEMTDKTFKTLNELDSRCFKGESLYPKIGSYWWIAYADGNEVGFAGLTVYDYIASPACFLSRAGVLQSARGLGIHKRMIRARERLARKIGYNRIITYTSYENIASANNLIKQGYLLYTPNHEWGIRNGLYFQKVTT